MGLWASSEGSRLWLTRWKQGAAPSTLTSKRPRPEKTQCARQLTISLDRCVHTPPSFLSWKLENLVLDNSVLWILQITKLSFQMFIAWILIVPTRPNMHSHMSSVPQNTLIWLHRVAGTHKLISNFRTLCSEEISGGSTNVKHTTGSSCRSPAPRLPICRELSRSITVPHSQKWSFGQMRPIKDLQSASVSRESIWALGKSSTPLTLQCTFILKGKAHYSDYKIILIQTH